jgi:2-hydroxy-6-oxonona-2,4-dienedioate hydrolase
MILNAQKTSEIKYFPNSRLMAIDGISVHYREWFPFNIKPKGQVLLVHGVFASTFCWRKNVDTLMDAGYQVVAVDVPPFGLSAKTKHFNSSQSNRADFLWKFISNLDASDSVKWNLVGHSMGGGIVEAMAILQPDKVQSVTLVDGAWFAETDPKKAWYWDFFNTDMLKMMTKKWNKSLLSFEKMEQMLEDTYQMKPTKEEVLGFQYPLQIEGTSPAIMKAAINLRETKKLRIEDFRVNTLVIWGDSDIVISPRKCTQLKEKLPLAEYHILPGAGHCPMETHPDEFNRILIEFLNRNHL